MLEASDVLTTIAEVGVAVAGFSGVVVVVGRGTEEPLDARQRYYLQALLEVAACAVFFSLLPLVLDRAFDEDRVWRVSMAIYGFGHFGGVAYHYFTLQGRRLTPKLFRLTALAGAALGLAQFASAFLGSIRVIEPFYLAVLVWHLGIGGAYFGLLLLSSHGSAAA